MAKRRVKAAEEWREYADGINEALASWMRYRSGTKVIASDY